MKIAVIGSTTFNDYDRVKKTLSFFQPTLIVSGAAKGADSLGEKYADENGIKKLIFPADWGNLTHPEAVIKTNKRGKQYDAMAGMRRNTTIVDNADMIIAFWSGKSPGTKDSIDKARIRKIPTLIIYF